MPIKRAHKISNYSGPTEFYCSGFLSGNLPIDWPTATATTIKAQVFMFRYERVNSTRKFTIFAEIVFLLKKIYKREGPLRAVF